MTHNWTGRSGCKNSRCLNSRTVRAGRLTGGLNASRAGEPAGLRTRRSVEEPLDILRLLDWKTILHSERSAEPGACSTASLHSSARRKLQLQICMCNVDIEILNEDSTSMWCPEISCFDCNLAASSAWHFAIEKNSLEFARIRKIKWASAHGESSLISA